MNDVATTRIRNDVLIRLLDDTRARSGRSDETSARGDRSYYRRIGVAFEAPNHYLKLSALGNLRLFAGLHGNQTEPPETA